MKTAKGVLAFDFGASSGRAMRGLFDGRRLRMEEIHRFSNDPVMLRGTFYWDTLRQFYEIGQGILKCRRQGGADSIGIDTWGVDFGLLDARGDLLDNHVNYRDTRTRGMIDEAARVMPRRELYGVTGIQFMECNTIYQLLALGRDRPGLLEQAQTLLFTPDLFAYFLTGKRRAEYTIASTSGLLDARTRQWADGVLARYGIPRHIFPDILMPGRVSGTLSPAAQEQFGVPAMPVVAVASHDTASAVVSVPRPEGKFAFLSSGTWSLLGTETDAPVLTPEALAANFTNEGGYDGTIRLLKNIVGLWLIQESRRQWQREGEELSFADLETAAREAKPFRSFIDPDEPDLLTPGDIPARIRAQCERTGQPVPQTRGEVMRCIYESLALKYRFSLEKLESITGTRYDGLHVIGGGVKDRLLCSLTACACGREVVAGPVEATVLGNISVQLMAAGEIASLAQARQVIADSFELTRFEPQGTSDWDTAAARYDRIFHIH